MPTKRRAPRRPAGPANQSRGSGQAAPESAAATSPFYDPAAGGAPVSHHGQQGPQGRSQLPDAPREDVHLGADLALGESTGDLDEDIKRVRAMRKPLGAFSQKLALPKRQGYYRHWFNDEPGRLDEAKEAGYAFIRDKDGKQYKRCVGTGRDRGALYAYAMEIPTVFWREDQDRKDQVAQRMLDSVKNPAQARPGEAKPSDRGKFYDPTESEAGPVRVEKNNSSEPIVQI